MKAAPLRALLFDLDGTLLDTAPDLVAALARVCGDEDVPAPSLAAARSAAGRGSLALLALAFGHDIAAPVTAGRRQRLLQYYADGIAVHTRPFPGVMAVLDALAARRLPWGIVTNKPGHLTTPLLAALGLADRVACVVAGDSLPVTKPHPAPLLAAAERLGRGAADCLYVGDSAADINAARAAGMASAAALWGYAEATDDPARWGADACLASPLDLLRWL